MIHELPFPSFPKRLQFELAGIADNEPFTSSQIENIACLPLLSDCVPM